MEPGFIKGRRGRWEDEEINGFMTINLNGSKD